MESSVFTSIDELKIEAFNSLVMLTKKSEDFIRSFDCSLFSFPELSLEELEEFYDV